MRINIVFRVVFLPWILTGTLVGGSYKFLRRTFRSEDEKRREMNHMQALVNSTQRLLRMPSILDPYTTARQHVDTEKRGEDSRLIIGILVENYSNYRLVDPITSKKTCSTNREINTPLRVEPGTSELFVVDNQGYKFRGVCGTFSWKIADTDGRAVISHGQGLLGRRFVVTFYVPYAGRCGPNGRFNSFSLNIWHAHLNQSQDWTSPELVESFYAIDHDDQAGSSFSDDGSEALALFDDDRFLLHGEMDRGCKPILNIRFMPSFRNKIHLWKVQEKGKDNSLKLTNPRDDAIEEDHQVSNYDGGYFSLTSVLSYSVILSAVVLAAVLALVLVKKINRVRKDRRAEDIDLNSDETAGSVALKGLLSSYAAQLQLAVEEAKLHQQKAFVCLCQLDP